MDSGTKSTTTRSTSTFCITCLWNRSRKNIQCCLMDCIMSCVTFFTFHFPTNSSHGSKDWWWASIFAFIACTQCLHFFQHLSVTSPQFFIALVSVVHLWAFLLMLTFFLDLFVVLLLILYGQTSFCLKFMCIDLHTTHSNYWITNKQKKNWWLVYNSTSSNNNLNNLKNREPTYVTIKKDQELSNKQLWCHACTLVCINLKK